VRAPPVTAESIRAATVEAPQWYGLDPDLGPCWVGQDGYACRYGYRRLDLRIRGLDGKQKRLSAHILAWLLDCLGPMERDDLYLAYLEFRASGLQLDHLCNEPSCRRPSHLNPCTQSENIRAGLERDYQRCLTRAPVEHYEEEEILPF
jgi:hypothetical protein